MATKNSSANPMTATDRRTFLQKVTAALGFMPLAGCALDSEGIPLDKPDDPQPFGGPPVTLRIGSLRPATMTALDRYTLEVYFEADVTGVGLRKHSQSFDKSQLQSVGPSTPFDVTDPFIIMLSESGSVLCRCTFIYAKPPEEPAPDPEVVEETHQKLADEELTWFKLIYVDPGYDIT
jgi:hypothetical protein